MEVDGSQSSKLQDYKLAIVAAQDVVFGLARTYGILTQRHVPNIGVFRDDREAAEWLGVTLGRMSRFIRAMNPVGAMVRCLHRVMAASVHFRGCGLSSPVIPAK